MLEIEDVRVPIDLIKSKRALTVNAGRTPWRPFCARWARMARRTGKATTHERAHADIQLMRDWDGQCRALGGYNNDTMNVIMIDRMNGHHNRCITQAASCGVRIQTETCGPVYSAGKAQRNTRNCRLWRD